MRPWGESSRYDVGVEWEERYMRVQVKSTIYKVGHAWVCNTRPDNDYRPYTVRQIDFLAAYVIPASCPTSCWDGFQLQNQSQKRRAGVPAPHLRDLLRVRHLLARLVVGAELLRHYL